MTFCFVLLYCFRDCIGFHRVFSDFSRFCGVFFGLTGFWNDNHLIGPIKRGFPWIETWNVFQRLEVAFYWIATHPDQSNRVMIECYWVSKGEDGLRSLFSGFYRVFVQFLSVVIHVFPRTNRMPNRVHGAVESCCFLKKKNLLLFSVVEGVSTDFNEASVFTCVERTVTSVYYFLMNLDSPVIRALFVTARLRFVVCFALLLFFFWFSLLQFYVFPVPFLGRPTLGFWLSAPMFFSSFSWIFSPAFT